MTDSSAGEGSLADLYENAPCGHFSTAPNGTIAKVNETFLRMGGYRRDQVQGKAFDELLDPASQLFFHTRYQPVLLLSGTVSGVFFSLKHTDGSTVPVLVNATMGRTSDGTAGWVRTAVFDATERRNYERELLAARRAAELSEQRVRVLEDAASTLGSADSEVALKTAASDIVRRAFDATSASVMIVTNGKVPATDGSFVEHLVPLDALWPTAQCARGVTAIPTAKLAENYPSFAAALGANQIQSLTVSPLLDGDRVDGVIACFFRRQRDFDDDACEMFTTLTNYAAQILKRIRLQDQLRHSALHDALTGLANRNLLTQRLDDALAASARHRSPMALIYLDLDGFKEINDKLGHAQGDAVLRETADRLRQVIRGSDTIARVGGDEFVIVCSDGTPSAATAVANRIRRAVGKNIDDLAPGFVLTASIGVALLEAGDSGPSGETLMRAADAAMYRSKKAGKNRKTTVTI